MAQGKETFIPDKKQGLRETYIENNAHKEYIAFYNDETKCCLKNIVYSKIKRAATFIVAVFYKKCRQMKRFLGWASVERILRMIRSNDV